MSIQQTPHEKMLSTVLKKFPLADQWARIKYDRSSYCKTKKDWVVLLVEIISSTVVCVGSWYLMYYFANASLQSKGAMDFTLLTFSLVAACVSSVMALTFCTMGVLSLYNAFTMKRMKNNPRSYKNRMRDYICEKTSVRYVQAMLPQLPTNDLKLLLQHPNFNPVFKKHFEEEFKRREALEAVDKINSTFLPSEVAVETDETKNEFTRVAVAKVNI